MKYNYEQIIIFFTSLPTLFISTVVAILRICQVSLPLKILCLLVFFSFSTEIIARILWLYKIPNLFLVPIYTIIELGLLLWLYSSILENKFLLRAKYYILLFFTIFLIYYEVYKSNKFLFNGIGRLIEGMIIISLVLVYFYQTFRNLKIGYLEREPLFWVSGGLLVFFSGNIFVFLFVNFIANYSQAINYQFWIIHALLTAILYGTYTYTLWIGQAK